jgi:putative ABC transport system permease protein
MYQSIRIAVRNVIRQKKRSLLLGGAVAFGFFIITLMNSLVAGVVDNAKVNFSHAFGGHLYLSGSMVSGRGSVLSVIGDASAAEAALAALGDDIASVHRRSRGSGSLYFGTMEVSQRMEGVDFEDEVDFRDNLELSRGSLAGIDEGNAIILPEDTVRKLGMNLGETLILKVATVTGQLNLGEFVLVATTESGSGLGLTSGFMQKAAFNRLIGLDEDGYQTINVYLKDIETVSAAASVVYEELELRGPVEPRIVAGNEMSKMAGLRRMFGMGGPASVGASGRWEGTRFTLSTIEDVMATMLSLVSALDVISLAVFLVLMVIIMVGIMNSYRMVLMERTAEIGTMRAIGVQRSGIRDIFLAEALTITILGAAGGFLLSLTIMGIASLIDLGGASFFSMFLSHGHVSIAFKPSAILMYFLMLCAMNLVAVYFPARSASRLNPASALQTTY